MTREALVGLIFAGAMAALGYFTIFVSDSDLFGLVGDKASKSYEYQVLFDRVNGLENGMKVKLDGWEIGEVTYLDGKPDGILVTFTCHRPHAWRPGDKVLIKDVSPLGGKYVDIERTDDTSQPASDQPPSGIRGAVLGGMLEEGGQAINEIRDDVARAIKEIKATFENLRKITDRIERGEGAIGRIFKEEALYNELLGTVKDLRKFSSELAEGEGTISKLIKDRELYDNLNEAVTKLDGIIAGVAEGKGTVGKLFNESTLHDDVQELVGEIRAAMKGDGTLGKLINDPSLYDNLNATVSEAKAMIADARGGKGTLGKLLNDDTLYTSLNQAILDVKEITAGLRRGEGTLGKLLTDDAVYNDLRRVLGELGKSLEDTREQAPINTFTSVVFSAF